MWLWRFKARRSPDDRKRIVARAAPEANAMRDYWIDTEHLPLGILAEPACLAAQHLGKTGITLESARRIVMENKHSRPDSGRDSAWPGRSPLKWGIVQGANI